MRAEHVGLVLAVLGMGCQPPRSAWTPGKSSAAIEASDLTARWEAERASTAPVELEATITSLDSDAPLASVRGRVDSHGAMVFETSEADAPTQARLSVRVEPRKQGGYALGVDWDERSAEGRAVSWSPSLVLDRGASSTAEIAWADGGGRRLSLRLHDPAAAPPAAPQVPAQAPAVAEVEASPSVSTATPSP